MALLSQQEPPRGTSAVTSTQPGTAQPLLRELITIPERVHQGDFVLRLTEGVQRRQATLDSYVITPQLRVAFDEALGLIGSALAEQRSKASYLHGSFGSGKSHFMAVLHALLDGDVSARSRHELADLVDRHSWLGDTRFLLVPYHLIGAESLEVAILGGYVNHIRAAHPGAPLPAVYRAQGLLADARAIRDRMGTEAFLAELPASGDPGWGEVDSGWSAAELDEAFDADPGSELAQRLISDVVPTFMPSYIEQNPSVSLLVDYYSPDWEALWWVRMDGRARVLEPGSAPDEAIGALRAKYPQYREASLDGPVIEIEPTRTTGWSYR